VSNRFNGFGPTRQKPLKTAERNVAASLRRAEAAVLMKFKSPVKSGQPRVIKSGRENGRAAERKHRRCGIFVVSGGTKRQAPSGAEYSGGKWLITPEYAAPDGASEFELGSAATGGN
jgi:hypothetical protein